MIKILKTSDKSQARLTEIKFAHGILETPFFMPDATRAVLKGLDSEDIKKLGLPALVVNTFHLYLQPGNALIKKFGGVHNYMDVDIPLVSDSGGFQVFSLLHKATNMGKLTDKGAKFKSPINGSWHFLDPKKSIEIQLDLGTDMVICLDDCPPNDASDKVMSLALERTVRWAGECKKVFEAEIKKRKIAKDKIPLLVAVIQGGESVELRKACAAQLVAIGFDGFGYGARPVDKNGNFLANVMSATAEACPTKSIRFALGIGTPQDIVRCSMMGYDMFDCVIPTREGRHGRLFYFNGKNFLSKNGRLLNFYTSINISNTRFSKDKSPINKDSALKELRNYSKGYLYHLFKVKDPLGARLASLQNLEFYTLLMSKIRKSILNNEM